MNIDVKFAELSQVVRADFGEVQTASDGGFERGYAAGYEHGRIDFYTPKQQKTIDITENGIVEVTPDDGYALSKVTANVNVKGVDYLAMRLTNKLPTYSSDVVTNVPNGAFRGCSSLMDVSLPNATNIEGSGFYGCNGLINIELPKATTFGTTIFMSCSNIPYVKFPSLKTAGSQFLRNCYALKTADLGQLESISTQVCDACYVLTAVILRRTDAICALTSTNAFNSCFRFSGTKNTVHNPDGLKDGYFYVPSALVEEYKTATNWSTIATQFRALEDYTVDGTTTGELDPTKI